MSHEVFISYCSEDKAVADAVCAGLEAGKARCWIAPRDVAPGENWAGSIIRGITEAKVMVVIFSAHTNRSRHVMNEIERAVSHGVTIIPFRIEAVPPSEDLELFISSCHWLDALTPPLEEKIGDLLRAVRRVLGRPEPAGAVASATRTAPAAKPRGRRVTGWLAAAAACAVIVAAGVWFFSTSRPKAPPTGVVLESPPDGAALLGPTLLKWSDDGLEKKNLEFELCLTGADGRATTHRFSRNSYAPRGISGAFAWKVRPVWAGEGDAGRLGPWSEERRFTYYQDALERILATKTINVGTAESGNIFVVKEDGEFTGFDIELLRRIGNGILEKHGVDGRVKIDYSHCVWGEELFRMPTENPGVDLLASGISITAERERKYRLVFGDPILRYPQTVVTLKGSPAFDGARLLPETVGATASTTNEELAKKIAGDARVVSYDGSGTYDRMFADLLSGKIGAVLLDKPYALQKLQELWPDGNPPVEITDVVASVVPGVEPEKIGFAFRISDSRLVSEFNAQLAQMAEEKRGLVRRFFARPEAFLSD
jgi:ABC-type amino acid transport substrate-binding protein